MSVSISPARTISATAFALVAFAFNSILCRLALGAAAIDAVSFTAIRLISGALVLYILLAVSRQLSPAGRGSWRGAAMLFLYAICFSFAYLELDTATGALILFAAVQLTMIVVAMLRGEHLNGLEWAGVIIAMAGLVYLLLPGAGAPTLGGFLLMAAAGVAWGFYTLFGRGSSHAMADTSWNFIRSAPLALVMIAFWFFAEGGWHVTGTGVLLAVLSGALASGLGYTAWYLALAGLGISQAAVLQLLVPVIAAVGGVFIVAESLTLDLLIAAVIILGGIATVLYGRQTTVSI